MPLKAREAAMDAIARDIAEAVDSDEVRGTARSGVLDVGVPEGVETFFKAVDVF